MKKYIMFDLDGTLIDSSKDVTRLLIKSLCDCGYNVPENTYIKIGPPLNKMIDATCSNISIEDNKKVVDYFRNLYKDNGTFYTEPYEGVIDLLKKLKSEGCKIFIVTYKLRPMCGGLLSKFFNDLYDDLVTPSDIEDFDNGKSKIDMFNLLFEKWNISSKDCVMIGDAKSDVECANKVGILSVGALYGYGDNDDLQNAKFKVSNPSEIYECIKKIKE